MRNSHMRDNSVPFSQLQFCTSEDAVQSLILQEVHERARIVIERIDRVSGGYHPFFYSLH